MSKLIEEIKKKLNEGDVERRFINTSEFRVEDEGKKIVGYAAKFNDLAPEYFGFREKIAEGAFTKTIQEADVRALFNHNPDMVLGRNKSGTLTLKEDKTGLFYEITPPDTSFARDLKESISRGDISQSSFGFNIVKDEWVEDENKGLIRTIKEVKLFDVSPVTYPWYPTTESSLRNKGKIAAGTRDLLIKALNNIELKAEEVKEIRSHIENLETKVAAWKYCICSSCNYFEEKTAGDACKLIKCPECGEELTGSNEKPEKKSEPKKENHSEKKEPPKDEEKHSKLEIEKEVLQKKLDLFEFEN